MPRRFGSDELTRPTLRSNSVRLAPLLIAAGLMVAGPAVAVATAGTGEGDGSASAQNAAPASSGTRPAGPARNVGTAPRTPTGRTAPSAAVPAAHAKPAAASGPVTIAPVARQAAPQQVAAQAITAALRTRRTPSSVDADTRPQALRTTVTQGGNFTGWAVGSSNDGYATIMRIDTKSNGFETVTRQGSAAQFADLTLEGVAAVSPRISWVAGQDSAGTYGVIFRTTDGGVTWKPQAVGKALEPLYGITAINRNKAWAVGESASVYFTRNGGRKWTQIASSQTLPAQGALQGVFAPSRNGHGRLWVTSTGDIEPHSISVIHSPNSASRFPSAIRWSTTSDTTTCAAECAMLSVTGTRNGRKLFAVGGKPYTVVASVDSGRHWTQQTLPRAGGANDANSVITLDGKNAWIVADYGNTWWTDDGGQQWNQVRVPSASGGYLLGVSTPDNTHLWAVGASRIPNSLEYGGLIAVSSDAGRSWQTVGGGVLPDAGRLWKVSVVSNHGLRI